MPACVVVPEQFCASSCHRARGTASLWMNTGCVAGRFFENDEVLKSIYFSMWKNFRTDPNMHSIS